MTGSTRPWRACAVALALVAALAMSCGLPAQSHPGGAPAAGVHAAGSQERTGVERASSSSPGVHPARGAGGSEPAPSCHRAPGDGAVPAVRGAVPQPPSLLPAGPRPGHEPERAHTTPAVDDPAPVRPPRPVDLSVLRV